MPDMPAPITPKLRDPTPSASLMSSLRDELGRKLPFSRMAAADVDAFIAAASLAYFAPGELILGPGSGPAAHLFCVRQGSVTERDGSDPADAAIEHAHGDLFPMAQAWAQQPVSASYRAHGDVFCWLLPAAAMQALAAQSPAFADFVTRHVLHLLELSRAAVQAAHSAQALAEQALEARLGSLQAKTLLTCAPDTPLRQALQAMQQRGVGSVLVIDASGRPQGILTQQDVIGRVTLPQLDLARPISTVMSSPLQTLSTEHTLQDAALLMARHSLRHVPVVAAGRAVNIVSERDLFALQRLSLRQLSGQIRAVEDVATMRPLAAQIRQFAQHLLGQGVQARQLTELISHLNDLLTERLLQLVAQRRGLDLQQACWLAFGSEGRSEQTVSTDQDNGLVFDSEHPERERGAWLAVALEVNEALDACGYPLCKGLVMASNPDCCLSVAEWQQRIGHWIAHGAPQDLLKASIHFDMRALAGRATLAEPLLAQIAHSAAALPRFLKQMADMALQQRAPLNWRGALDTVDVDGRELLDLKLQGTALYVAAARLFALAQGASATSTRGRFEAVALAMQVPAHESQAWVTGFEFLQTLRLRLQLGALSAAAASAGVSAAGDSAPRNANQIDINSLNDMDRRMLKEACRIARGLQQRVALDYPD